MGGYIGSEKTVALYDSYTKRETDELNESSTRMLLKRQCAEAGLTLVDGSFEEGATVSLKSEVVWHQATGKIFGWFQDAVKTVGAGSTPATTGGIGAGAWVDRTDDSLRDEIRETVFQNMKRLYAESGLNLVDGSFQMGGSLSGWPDVLWDWTSGKGYQWHLDEAKTVSAGSTPTNIGTDWIDRSINSLRDDLKSPMSALGSFLVAYKSGTVFDELSTAPSPTAFGAPANGVDDDSAFIISALAITPVLDMRNRTWVINQTIDLPSKCSLDFRGATITFGVGSNPAFTFDNKSFLYLNGGIFGGTASTFLTATGATDTPTSASQYATDIHLNNVIVSSTTIDLFLDCQKAVRRIHLVDCCAFTGSGINYNGKIVETFISGGMYYSSTGASGTYGIKTRSSGGTSYYNEGIQMVNVSIDNHEVGADIADLFMWTLTGGWISSSGSNSVNITGRTGTITHCRDFVWSGTVFGNNIACSAQSSGLALHMQASAIKVLGKVSFASNISNVVINGIDLSDATGTQAAILIPNNASYITVDHVTTDSTFTISVAVTGTSGANINIGIDKHGGSNVPVYAERPFTSKGVPVLATGVDRVFNTSELHGTYSVSSNIASVSAKLAKGDKGVIHCKLSASGMDAANQIIQVALPTGMTVASGSGWAATYTYPMVSQGLISFSIPFFVTADINGGTLSLVNYAGNSMVVGYHGSFGYVKS